MQNLEQSPSKFSTYPPTVLLVDENSPSILELKRGLEKKQCQVHQTDIIDENLLATAHQEDFELLVLNVEFLEGVCEVFQKLQNRGELTDIPIVILTKGKKFDTEKINKIKGKYQIYYLPVDEPFTEATLWQIIEWKHYLTHRYN